MVRPVRLLSSAALAAVITIGLFFVMYSLVRQEAVIDDKKAEKIVDISMPETEIDVNIKEAKPDKPEDPDEPPPPLELPKLTDVKIDTAALNVSFTPKADIQIGAAGLSVSDGEYLPIVKVAPIYPNRANTRGIEGYCIVEYVVTTSGSIRDPKPVDCQPEGYFETASVKAALKFKYKPRVIDGNAVEVAGVQNKFTYTLEE